MKSLEVQIEEPTADGLEAAAEKLGITPEALICFQPSANKPLSKILYKRGRQT